MSFSKLLVAFLAFLVRLLPLLGIETHQFLLLHIFASHELLAKLVCLAAFHHRLQLFVHEFIQGVLFGLVRRVAIHDHLAEAVNEEEVLGW